MTSHWHTRRFTESKSRPSDHRNHYEKDRARIIHAAAFRRLQAKTQIMGMGVNDFYRTRLTHSLEVAQIGRGLLGNLAARDEHTSLLPNESLLETLCLAHDIGHPPFGHGGEIALNYAMREHGGFEGNAQTLRIVAKLEPYTQGYGMNLTRRTLLGFIKYPAMMAEVVKATPPSGQARFINSRDFRPAKGIYQDDSAIFDWILAPLSDDDRALFTQVAPLDAYRNKTCFKSFDASIMELADDIAYAIHDFEDAIATGTIDAIAFNQNLLPELLSANTGHSELFEGLKERLFLEGDAARKDAIGELVNLFITHAEISEQDARFHSPLLKYQVGLPASYQTALNAFKQFIYTQVIRHPLMQQIEFKGQKLVLDLFDAFISDPMRLLPHTTATRYQNAFDSKENTTRVICDYISGMSDDYALKVHKRLFSTDSFAP